MRKRYKKRGWDLVKRRLQQESRLLKGTHHGVRNTSFIYTHTYYLYFSFFITTETHQIAKSLKLTTLQTHTSQTWVICPLKAYIEAIFTPRPKIRCWTSTLPASTSSSLITSRPSKYSTSSEDKLKIMWVCISVHFFACKNTWNGGHVCTSGYKGVILYTGYWQGKGFLLYSSTQYCLYMHDRWSWIVPFRVSF